MKNIILLLVFVTAPILLNAQIITVQDGETGEPLDLVSFVSYNPNIFKQTNKLGQVDISSFEGAEYMEIIFLGYKKIVTSYAELAKGDPTIKIQPLAFSGDAIVVSAHKWNQNIRDIPARVTTITPLDQTLNQPQTTADLLGNSGEVFIQKSQLGGGSPMIRGFSTNRLLYSVDGVRMNTAIFRGGNLQNVISLDPFAIERTEVIFGPGSVIYGSDAIGAVMSFTTLVPELSATDEIFVTGSAVARYSTASNEKTTHFDINLGWKKWALLTSFSGNNFGDMKMGSYGPTEYLRPFYVKRQDSMDVVVTNEDPRIQTPSGYTQMNLMQKVRYKPNDKWDFQYGFHYSETSDYSRYDRHIRYKNGLPRYGEWSYGPQKWMMNNLSINHQGNNFMYDQMSIRIAQQSFEESRISRDFNKTSRETRIENVYAYSANVDFNKSLGKKNQLYYGLEAVYNDVVSRGIDEDISTGEKTLGAARYPQSQWYSYGAYVSDQYKPIDQVTVTGGVRYSIYMLDAKFDTTFYPFPFTTASLNNGALTGDLGAIYRPNNKWKISLNASTGFRSPNIDDVGKVFDSEPGSVVVPNPNLKAEYAYNAELGVSKTFGDFLNIGAVGYYTILQNALVRRDYTLNGLDSIDYDGELSQVQAMQNAAVATVYGAQGSIRIQTPGGFMFSSQINWQVGEEELDDGSKSPSRHAAPMFGVTRIGYSIKGLTFEVNAQYSDGKSYDELPEEEKGKDYIYAIDADGNPYSPSWYTVNIKTMYKFATHFTVSAGVENLTDQRYKTYSSGIVAPGRNFIFSMKATF